MEYDTLSEVLRSVRLRGAVFFYVEGGRDWAAAAPPAAEIADAVMPGAEHVMEYHVVMKGEAWAAAEGEPPVHLVEGDIVLFPRGDPHVISSAPNLPYEPANVAWHREAAGAPKPIPVAFHGTLKSPDGPRASITASSVLVCGFLGCDASPFNPLVGTLPRILHIPADGDDRWDAAVMRQAVIESRGSRPGSEAVLERLSEMMFVDALRRYVDRLPHGSIGWLAGLRDPLVGKTLALMHEDPSKAWSVESLGEAVGLSRSALHERFVRFLGQAPMQYLAAWRMQAAASRLLATHDSVASIGLSLGYESEAAFSRAFKRIVGVSPSAWRRGERVARENAA